MRLIEHLKTRNSLLALSFVGAMGPVFVKRAIFVGQYSYSEWLIADYSARVVIIFFSVYALRSGLVRSDHKAAGFIRSVPIFVIALSAMAMTQILRLGAPFDVVLWKPLIDPVLDIDQRLAVFRQTKQTAQGQVAQAQAAQNAVAQQQRAEASADFQNQRANYSNPLDKGAYDQSRSVVDSYDWLSRRYHIGVFGQRIYK